MRPHGELTTYGGRRTLRARCAPRGGTIMRSRWIHAGVRLSYAAVVCAVLAGCSSDKQTAQKETERTNDVKPNANARIMSQTVFGDADKYSVVRHLELADDGSLCFTGYNNSLLGAGGVGGSGAVRRFQHMSYDRRDVRSLPATAIVPHGVVVGGSLDTDGDNESELGYASLYSATGTLMSQLLVSSDSSDVFIDQIVPVGESTYIACGGERRSGVAHPYLAVVNLRAPGKLEPGKFATLPSVTGWFTNLVMLPSTSSVLVLAAASNNNLTGGGTSRSIHEIRAAWPAFDPVAVEWTQDIVPTTGEWIAVYDLQQSGGNIYVAGTVRDNRKPPPNSGGPWYSGLAASYTSAGVQRWINIVSVSQNDDAFRSILIGADVVYLLGDAVQFVIGETPQDDFGYGWVSKLSTSTGAVLANSTVGDDKYASGFWGGGGG